MSKSTDRVRQILSWYASDNPGVLTNLARLHQPRHARRHRQAGHPPRRPGLRARPGALVRAQPGRLRSRLSLPARHRRRLQRLRGAARLPRGERRRSSPARSRSSSSSTTPTRWPRWSRCSAVTGSVKDALRLGCSAIGFTIYPGSSARNTMYEEIRELILEAKDARPADGDVGLSARRGPRQGGRAGRRRHGVRGADRLPARRARREGQAAEGRRLPGRGEEGLREVRHPDQDAGRSRAPRRAVVLQRASASSSSRAARRRTTRRCSRRSSSIAAGGGVRLDHGAQRVPAAARRARSSCSPTS